MKKQRFTYPRAVLVCLDPFTARPTDPYVAVSEAARLIGVSNNSVGEWAALGHFRGAVDRRSSGGQRAHWTLPLCEVERVRAACEAYRASHPPKPAPKPEVAKVTAPAVDVTDPDLSASVWALASSLRENAGELARMREALVQLIDLFDYERRRSARLEQNNASLQLLVQQAAGEAGRPS